MTASSTADVLVDRWRKALACGRDPSPEELCREEPAISPSPEVLAEARRRIEEEKVWEAGRPGGHDPPAAAGVWRRGGQPLPGYQLKEDAPFARGGAGEVWKASGRGRDNLVLKRVLRGSRLSEAEREALRRLRQIPAHAHLATWHDFVERDDELVVVMDRADCSLQDLLDRKYRDGLPPETVLRLLEEAARGLDFLRAHEAGVGGPKVLWQHRDVKPANLLLFGGTVKVADFGLAKRFEGTWASHTGDGTPGYAAPERDGRLLHEHSDQYSLAVTFVALRTGAPDRLEALRARRPREAEVVRRATGEPGRRFRSCEDFVAALRRVIVPAGLTPGQLERLRGHGERGGAVDWDALYRESVPADLRREEDAGLAGVDLLYALAGIPPGDRRLPPAVEFLERWAECATEPEARIDLRACADDLAAHHGRAEQLRAFRDRARQPRRAAQAYLLVRVMPGAGEGGGYLVRMVLEQDAGEESPPVVLDGHDVERPVSAEALREELFRYLADVFRRFPDIEREHLTIEFCLPRDLLVRWDVDAWILAEDPRYGFPLGSLHPVVVRWDDPRRPRVPSGTGRRRWRRMQTLEECSPGEHFHWIAEPPDRHPGGRELLSRLESAAECVGVVLLHPPRERAAAEDALQTACLACEIPVALWVRERRAAWSAAQVRARLRRLLARGPVRGLKATLREERRDRARGPADLESHLTLLWDDPHRPLPPPFEHPD